MGRGYKIIFEIGKHLPNSLKPMARKIYFYNTSNSPSGDDLIPPKRLTNLYASANEREFRNRGNNISRLIIKCTDLRPNERVLDVGCGIGLVAIPLTSYLEIGHYEGFDIIPECIKWCQRNITPKFSNFHFQVADIYNQMYNPNGQYEASQYRFPYDDGSFDLVFLSSIFTHLRTKDMEHYLSEIVRVLNKDGRCFITYFLINRETVELMKNGVSSHDFNHKLDEHCYTIASDDDAEKAIGYDDIFIRKLYKNHGLRIKAIVYGEWRNTNNQHQDLIVASV
jgi:SAM-dependent methyltransferase